jgi:hypothetical protein
LHNEEIRKLVLFAKYSYSEQVRDIEMAGSVGIMGKKRNAYRVLVEKPQGKRPL